MAVLTRMRVLRVEAPGRVGVVELDLPEPGQAEVLVRVAAAGICGSDLEVLEGRRPAAYVRYPVVPGHEWAGTIAALGPGVRGLGTGDKVVAEGFRNCGLCDRCREGETNLCTADYAETGFTHPGAFAGYLVVPARLIHRLPETASLDEAALLEPLACVANGILAAPPRPGQAVAVVGAGTLGLLAVATLRAYSPRELTLVGTRADRLAVGTRLGATRILNIRDSAIGELAGSADLVFEAAGRAEAVRLALGLARRGGSVVLEGIAGHAPIELEPDVFALQHLRIQGIFGASSRAWQHAVSLFATRSLPLSMLITHRFPLAQYAQAFAALRDRSAGAIKVLLVPDHHPAD